LGSVNNGLVSLNPILQGFILNYDNVRNLEDIQLSQQALIDGSGISSGAIQVQAANLTLTDGSMALNQNQGFQSSGNINIKTSNLLKLNGTTPDGLIPSGLVSETLGIGSGGTIDISTKSLLIQDGASIAARAYGSGKEGFLNVNASDSIKLSGFSPKLIFLGISGIRASSLGTVNFGFGGGGDVNLLTKSLTVEGGARVGTATYTTATGGNLTINAPKFTQIIGAAASQIPSAISTTTFGLGHGGNLTLSTEILTAVDGGSISSLTLGSGVGGNVIVNVSDSINLTGILQTNFSPSVLETGAFSSGNAGNLTISTSRLVVQAGGRVDAATLASGKAGNITINAFDSIEVSGKVKDSVNPSLIDSSASILDEKLQELYNLPSKPNGNPGDITINTGRLSVTNGGLVSVQNQGLGTNAGTLRVNANSINLDNQGGITASTVNGIGGDIFLHLANQLSQKPECLTEVVESQPK